MNRMHLAETFPAMSPSPPDLLTVEQRPDLMMVRLHPRMMEAPWDEIEQAGEEVLATLSRHEGALYLVDLSELRHLGSAQLAFLVRVWKAVQGRDGHCVVCCPREDVREIIKLAGLHRLWTISPDLEEARTLLRQWRPRWISRRARLFCFAAGGLGVAVGLAGLILKFFALHPESPLPMWLYYGGAAVGAVAGLVIGLLDRGDQRARGFALMVVALGVAAAGYWWRW